MTTAHNAPKLPSKQLAILAVARFAEPLAMTSVYPYLPEMIASFGVEKKDIAKWAGLTSAVFSLAQSITAVPWGRASDRFGRKPVIMTGLLCTMVCFLIWGCSTSLTMAIIVRAVQGASNGNVGIIRTMVAEMVPQRELQPKAFSIMPLVWSIGSIFGPAFGGFFANPATQFPDVFGNSTFLKKFPFALPNIMGSLIFLLSLTVGTLFLKETLERKRHVRDYGLVLGERLMAPFTKQNHHHHHHHHRRYSFQDDEMTAPLLAANNDHHARQSHDHEAKTDVPSSPSMKAVFTRQTVINLVSYTFLALHSVAYDQVLSVFLNYPRQHHDASNTHLPFLFSGGFGLNSGRIGTIFTLYGIICGLIQFILFPTLCSYFGVLNCFRGCAVTFPIVYVLTPCTTLIEDETLRFAALLAVLIVKAFAVIVGFPCTTILLTNSASSLSILGTLNGFATMFSALGRAAGPAMTGAAFTWGVKRGAIAVPWWILAAIASVGAIQAWQIEEQDGPSRAADSDSDSDSEMENGDEDTAVEQLEPVRRTSAIVFGNGSDELRPMENDAMIHEPTARDDLPLLGSTKSSSRGLVDYGSMTRQSSDRR